LLVHPGERALDQAEVRDQLRKGRFPLVLSPQPQKRRRVVGGEHERGVSALHEFSARLRHPEVGAEQRARRGGAQAGNDARANDRDLAFQPLAAGVDLALRRGLVQPPLAAQLPFEMLHRVGHVDVLAVDAGGLERPVEEASGGPDEGQPLAVLLVAGLLADQHDLRVLVAGAEHRLRSVLPERAGPAAFRFLAQLFQRFRHRAFRICPMPEVQRKRS